MRISLAVIALAAALAAPVAAHAADYPEDDYGAETRSYERAPVVHRRVVVEEPIEEPIEEEIVVRRPRAVVVAPGVYYGRPGWGYGRRTGYYRGGYGYGRGYSFRGGGRYAGYRGGGGWGGHRGRW